ncbi:hypothetical protein OH76DRAFT_1412441 [Lentinus brumalis]|uniref:Uncharacterized protein n=1 Tax=Lentinus brumalis TaxID=2498619 RepID=A0A371CL91_9APHY|nr:hypothetical protein OH76DRAFT_1412441 [Polyporus brumalis]
MTRAQEHDRSVLPTRSLPRPHSFGHRGYRPAYWAPVDSCDWEFCLDRTVDVQRMFSEPYSWLAGYSIPRVHACSPPASPSPSTPDEDPRESMTASFVTSESLLNQLNHVWTSRRASPAQLVADLGSRDRDLCRMLWESCTAPRCARQRCDCQ